ncbi:MAG: hypothetical protein HY267_08440 [Deltaproteobacteria bacterium]|nr:hypothetical protein [Deltaproteobacteria bacterium]
MMTRRMLQFSTSVGVMIVLAALTMLIRGTPSAAEGNAQDTCTLKTIKGTYLFQAQGAVLSEGEVRPYAEAGTWTLDGKGNATGVFSAGIDGVAIATQEAFTATYQLESGCVFTAFAPVGTEVFVFHLYTTPAGKTMTYFSPGFSGTQVRQ